MKRGLKLAFPLLLSLQLTGCTNSPKDASDVPILVRDNTSFACDLYRSLSRTEGNIFFSPYSISTILSLTCAGAGGNTEAQMKSALRFSLDKDRRNHAFSKLRDTDDTIRKNGTVVLDAANSLWPQQDYKLRNAFLSLAKKRYGVTVTPLDYMRETENSRQRINKWVADATRNRIMDIIQPGVLNTSTRIALVNAIYFKGTWLSQFAINKTQNAPFYLKPDQPVQVSMMCQTEMFRYGKADSIQILDLPYLGNGVSMIVFLPVEKNGLVSLESRLSAENLERWISLQKKQLVLVFFPKFRMTCQFKLNAVLGSMGMVDAFNPGADFSGMTDDPGLFISAVVHKAFVDVNEKGTEAGASTVVVGEGASPPRFRADHPFLFLIRENATGSILFMGRVTDPTKS